MPRTPDVSAHLGENPGASASVGAARLMGRVGSTGGRTDVEIIKAAQDGDERAWTAIYETLQPPLFGYLRVRAAADPENLLGEVFFRLARSIHRFRGDFVGLKAYAMTIAANLLRDSARRQAVRPLLSLVDPSTMESTASSDASGASSDAYEGVISMPFLEIQSAFDLLTEDQREVLYLRFAGDLSLEQTAKALGRTTGAVKQLQHRGLERLRQALPVAPDETARETNP